MFSFTRLCRDKYAICNAGRFIRRLPKTTQENIDYPKMETDMVNSSGVDITISYREGVYGTLLCIIFINANIIC